MKLVLTVVVGIHVCVCENVLTFPSHCGIKEQLKEKMEENIFSFAVDAAAAGKVWEFTRNICVCAASFISVKDALLGRVVTNYSGRI